MHPFVDEVFPKLDASRAALRETMARLPVALRRQRPAPERWSAVEIVEHLSLVESRFCAVVGAKIDEAIRNGLGPELGIRAPLPDATAGMLADRNMRRTAPDPAQPSGALDEAAAWDAADRARSAFKATVLRGDGLALSTVIHPHPFFGALTVYQWVELIAMHEMRHVEQLCELTDAFSVQGSS